MTQGEEIILDQSEIAQENTDQIIKNQIKDNELLVYMKGNAMMPQCGFSARVVQILDLIGRPYKTFNILNNEQIRNAIKAYSNWPTIPQVYYKEEFLGGCDIITEMYQNGELAELMEE